MEFFILDNVLAGINSGIDEVFRNAPIDVTGLEIRETEVIVTVAKSGRTPLLTPTPAPTPAGMVIYNDLGQDIILEIEGKSWSIPTNGKQIVDKLPGTYFYTVYDKNRQVVTHGKKVFFAHAYRLQADFLIAEKETEP